MATIVSKKNRILLLALLLIQQLVLTTESVLASTTIVCKVPEKTLFLKGWDGHGEKFTSEDADVFVINDQGSTDD